MKRGKEVMGPNVPYCAIPFPNPRPPPRSLPCRGHGPTSVKCGFLESILWGYVRGGVFFFFFPRNWGIWAHVRVCVESSSHALRTKTSSVSRCCFFYFFFGPGPGGRLSALGLFGGGGGRGFEMVRGIKDADLLVGFFLFWGKPKPPQKKKFLPPPPFFYCSDPRLVISVICVTEPGSIMCGSRFGG